MFIGIDAVNKTAFDVIYIAGYGRSGSTLLELLLGAIPGAFGGGELHGIYSLKGCFNSMSPEVSEFWGKVWGCLFKKMPRLEVEGAQRRQLNFESLVSLPRHLCRYRSHDVDCYGEVQAKLFESIREVSTQETVIDSSKSTRLTAFRPVALARYAGQNVKMIHLVRDGRAVLWSQMRGDNKKIESGSCDTSLPFALPRTLIGWVFANCSAWIAGLLLPSGSTIRVRYEDLAKCPAHELKRIGDFLSLDTNAIVVMLDKAEHIAPGVQFSGNRMRFKGITKIKNDDEWRSRLPFFAHCMYWLFCGPWHALFCRKTREVNQKC